MAWLSREDEEGIRLPLEEEFNLAPGCLITHLSHSHGAPFTDPLWQMRPGPSNPGLPKANSEDMSAALHEAFENKRACVLSWGIGRCGLLSIGI